MLTYQRSVSSQDHPRRPQAPPDRHGRDEIVLVANLPLRLFSRLLLVAYLQSLSSRLSQHFDLVVSMLLYTSAIDAVIRGLLALG